jgi:hypothetical protein
VSLTETLLAIERALAAGGADAYRRVLDPDAILIVPGMVLDRVETIAAMDASPGWDEFTMARERVVELADGAALLTYRFDGRRGDVRYAAQMGSVYVERDGGWRMIFHQQTPIGG